MQTKFFLGAVLTVMVGGWLLAAEGNTTDTLAQVGDNLNKRKAVLVDVREEQEWKQGYIDGSLHIPLSMLSLAVSDKQKEVNEAALKGLGEVLEKMLPKKAIIYTYCASGVRSIEAGKILSQLGYEVRPLKPGYKELVEAGYPRAGGGMARNSGPAPAPAPR